MTNKPPSSRLKELLASLMTKEHQLPEWTKQKQQDYLKKLWNELYSIAEEVEAMENDTEEWDKGYDMGYEDGKYDGWEAAKEDEARQDAIRQRR